MTNHGPGDAYDVDLSDQLPADDWTLGGDDAEACQISDTNLLTCDFGDIAAEDSRTITVSKTVTTADCGVIPNEVTVGASNESPEDAANNTDNAEITVACEFGLIIDKTNDAPLGILELPDGSTADLPTADEGETVTYTLAYTLLAMRSRTRSSPTSCRPVSPTWMAPRPTMPSSPSRATTTPRGP